MKLTIAFLTSVLTVAAAASEGSPRTFSGIRTLKFTSLQGQTQIQRSTNGETSVAVQKGNFSDRCDLAIRQNGEVLEVEVSKGWVFTSGVSCEANFVIAVPEETRVTAYQATGAIAIAELSGPVSVKSPSAQVTLTDAPSRELLVEAVSGSVALTYANAAPGRIRINTTSSSATYSSAAPTRVTFSSLSGRQVTEGKPVTASAASEIEFSSVSGSFVWR